MPEAYTVKLSQFEGPLDLLLHLIEERKLHINDISLAKITDGYLSHIEQFKEFPIRDAAHFILIASTLVLIKSRSLLPFLTLTDEEKESIEDLEARLKAYRRIKELSRHVAKRFGERILFFRGPPSTIISVFSPTEEITKTGILQAMRSVLMSLPKREMVPQLIIRKVMSLEEMIEDLTERITSSLSLSFKDFAKMRKSERAHMIISFLAVLELVKRGIISVKQNKHFEDIMMESNKLGVPKY